MNKIVPVSPAKNISDSVGCLLEITTRMDERMKNYVRNQEILEEKLCEAEKLYHEITSRLSIIEAIKDELKEQLGNVKDDSEDDLKDTTKRLDILEEKLQEIEMKLDTQEGRWKKVIELGINLFWIVLASYIVYKLGLQPPGVS